ncbi:MAG TPA: hypothetical protein VEK85_17200 [Gemmatimonadales bacterium]|nr:hypothetical protein [Gemmatimonadales bacterium]
MRGRSGEFWRGYYALGATPGILVDKLFGPEVKRDTCDQGIGVSVAAVDAAYTRIAGAGAAIRPTGGGAWYCQSNESGNDSSERIFWGAGTINGGYAQTCQADCSIVSYAGSGTCDVGVFVGDADAGNQQRAYLTWRAGGQLEAWDAVAGSVFLANGLAWGPPSTKALKIVVGADRRARFYVDGALMRTSAALAFTYGTHRRSGVVVSLGATSVSRVQWDNLLIRGTSE